MAQKRRNVASTHLKLTLPDNPTTLESNLDLCLQKARNQAYKIARRILVGENVRLDNEVHRLTKMHSRTEKPRELATLHLSCAIMFTIIAQLIPEERREKIEPCEYGKSWDKVRLFSVANTQLILCLFMLEHRERERVHNLVESQHGILDNSWNGRFWGAMAVCRLARELLKIGAQVFLPTSSEDVHEKIDLIARYPGATHAACFQVRGTYNYRFDVNYHVVQRGDIRGPDDQQLIRGVNAFAGRYKGLFVPVSIEIGTGTYRSYTLERYAPLLPWEIIFGDAYQPTPMPTLNAQRVASG
jgi:hypothetical protein